MIESVFSSLIAMDYLEALGLVFGLLCVWLLIRQSIWTWPAGIAYVLISLQVFYVARLYADLALHLFYLAVNIYGWYYWLYGVPPGEEQLPVTQSSTRSLIAVLVGSGVCIVIAGTLFAMYTDADLVYWDNTTTILSLIAMWLQTRKKLESWLFWLIVDLLATGIYVYKGLYFYSILYLVYVGMAVAGFVAWRRSMLDHEIRNAQPA
jgi:nicotinamide mononucleotide transporter